MKVIIILLAVSLAAPVVYAGPGHDHAHEKISQDVAGRMAAKKIDQLVEKNIIPASWQKIVPARVEKKTFAKGPEWMVVFKNPKIGDKSKQTLYVFFSEDGHYLATNYTGD